jgi:DMSO/TMAO reductase YedYZ molybdopterin-dependent catalytic subunit
VTDDAYSPHPTDPKLRARLPPGQSLTRRFPVLHEGGPPAFDPATFRLRIDGAVEHPLEFTWKQYRELPRASVLADFHCVTRWSRFDNRWEGVALKTFAERAGVLPSARFVRFEDHQGYDTSVPLDVALRDDSLLADSHDGAPLAPEHGGPLRAVISRLYAWKSCKWVVRVEFLEGDRLGFWETRGYHNGADPWREERFS